MHSLRRIILPEGLVEIGESAFCYAIALEDVNFPSSLRAIKRRCFSDCISINVNPLVVPEGVEEIGYMSFVNCKSLTGRVILPTTLKKSMEEHSSHLKLQNVISRKGWRKSETQLSMRLV